MDVSHVWSDHLPEKDGEKVAVNDVAFSPDGTRVVAGVGNHVLLYQASTGELIEKLRGHKDTVYCVSYSADGSRFASGGADNVVIIWKNTGQGLLKFNHSASIQQVKYNPCQLLLASCSEVDFGLWSPDQKQVTKEKVPSRILSASWSSDGQVLALGMLSGLISLRNQQAEEILKFERNGPVWCLAFVPDNTPRPSPTAGVVDYSDQLAICCWDRTYSLYRLGKKEVLLNEKTLPYYPCGMTCVNNPQQKSCYLVVTGSNKQVQILSRDGTKLADILKTPSDSWIWSNACHAEDGTIAYATHSGEVNLLKMSNNYLFSFYNDKLAYRENLTEVIIHHLAVDKKVRIKCKDIIHNLFLYKNKLAVQLFDKICIYESAADENSQDMHFKLNKTRILLSSMGLNTSTRMVSNLLCITSQHVLIAIGNILELYSFQGIRLKVYTFDAKITSLKVEGGIEGREGILICAGSISKIFVDNFFPIVIAPRKDIIIAVEGNVYKTLLAIVDNTNKLMVINMLSQEVIYTLERVQKIVWNADINHLLALTNLDGKISILSIHPGNSSGPGFPGTASASGTIDIFDQHLLGSVVCYQGSRIYTMAPSALLSATDIPQGAFMKNAFMHNNYQLAYQYACLGATDTEWRALGLKALRAGEIAIAKHAFVRLRDVKYLDLIEGMEGARESSTAAVAGKSVGKVEQPVAGAQAKRSRHTPAPSVAPAQPMITSTASNTLTASQSATILAYEGHYSEAAKTYMRAANPTAALQVFVDLKLFNDAKLFAQGTNNTAVVNDLTVQQAAWLQETKDWKGAAELFASMGQYDRAAHIIGDNEGPNWAAAMIEIVRSCSLEDRSTLLYCGDRLSTLEDVAGAKEAYTKAGDVNKLMSLYVGKKMWNDAAKLADDSTGKFDMSVFLSYAEWLVSQEQYLEAMEAFKKCQRGDLGRVLLCELTDNAVGECRFKDAGYYYWMLAKEVESEICLLDRHLQSPEAGVLTNSTITALSPQALSSYLGKLSALHAEYEHKADLYYAYASIHSYVTDPFTSYTPEMLFQTSRFIINSLGTAEVVPAGISKTSTLYTLAKQAMALGAYKLARNAFDRLQKLFITPRFGDIELDMLLVQAKPVRDHPDILPVCYRCGSTNPLLNPFNNKFSKGDLCTNCGHHFVRNFINFDILPLVEFLPCAGITDEEAIDMIRTNPSARRKASNNMGEMVGGANVYSLDNDLDTTAHDEGDLFTNCLNNTLEKQKTTYSPVQVDANTLLAMKRSDVFVCKPSSPNKRATFYKNMLPDIPIAISQACHRFFHLEDFEFAYLSEKKCPYSRLKNVGEYGSL